MIAASMIARIVDDAGGPSAPLIYLPGVDGTGELLLGTAARLIERFRLIRLRYELVPGTPLVGSWASSWNSIKPIPAAPCM